jgi:hypothetical protein
MKKHINILITVAVAQFVAIGFLTADNYDTRQKNDILYEVSGQIMDELNRCNDIAYPNVPDIDSLSVSYIKGQVIIGDL